MTGLKKTKSIYMLFTKASLQGEGHIRTDNEEMEKDISQKQAQESKG